MKILPTRRADYGIRRLVLCVPKACGCRITHPIPPNRNYPQLVVCAIIWETESTDVGNGASSSLIGPG
jgi:hypothetical protein